MKVKSGLTQAKTINCQLTACETVCWLHYQNLIVLTKTIHKNIDFVNLHFLTVVFVAHHTNGTTGVDYQHLCLHAVLWQIAGTCIASHFEHGKFECWVLANGKVSAAKMRITIIWNFPKKLACKKQSKPKRANLPWSHTANGFLEGISIEKRWQEAIFYFRHWCFHHDPLVFRVVHFVLVWVCKTLVQILSVKKLMQCLFWHLTVMLDV